MRQYWISVGYRVKNGLVSASLGDDSVLGDMNGDGSVNVQDIVMIINMVIGNTDVDLNADINFDGAVDVLDIVLLVNIILGS